MFAAKLARAKETAKDYELRTQHNIQAAQQEQDKEFKSILKEGHRAKTRAVNTLLAAGGTQGNLMDMELAQHDSKSSLNPGTAMPPPSQIASPLDTKMKVLPSAPGTTLNVEALGLPMIQWKMKVRVTVKTTKSIIENEKDFFEQAQVLHGKMLELDPALRLVPLETTTEDISIHAMRGLSSDTREKLSSNAPI